MKRLFQLDAFLIVVVSLIEALGMAVAHAAEDGNFAGLVDIGGSRKMYLKCSGSGSPTVVLVGGLRNLATCICLDATARIAPGGLAIQMYGSQARPELSDEHHRLAVTRLYIWQPDRRN